MTINDLVLTNNIKYQIRKSPIHGNGIFPTMPLRIGYKLGIAMSLIHNASIWSDETVIRTDLGRYMNHSDNPNVTVSKVGKHIIYIVSKNVTSNDELLVNYNDFNF